MLQTVVLFCHLAVALLIIGLVLLQRGKGADAGTGFGAGASGTVFGARGTASFFSRATAVLATVFFVTSLALAYLAGQTSEPTSILDALDESTGVGIQPAPLPEPNALPDIAPDASQLPPVAAPGAGASGDAPPGAGDGTDTGLPDVPEARDAAASDE